MGRRTAANPAGDAVHRPAVGVPAADLDSGPLYLAVADDEDYVGIARDGFPQDLFEQHCLSEYRVS